MNDVDVGVGPCWDGDRLASNGSNTPAFRTRSRISTPSAAMFPRHHALWRGDRRRGGGGSATCASQFRAPETTRAPTSSARVTTAKTPSNIEHHPDTTSLSRKTNARANRNKQSAKEAQHETHAHKYKTQKLPPTPAWAARRPALSDEGRGWRAEP